MSPATGAVRRSSHYVALWAVVALFAAGELIYSQTLAFTWDEGFHLLTAQLIDAGKRPYIDFFFPQTPLNAYWNAAWMRIFGESWRVTHAVAALASTGAVALAAHFAFQRFPIERWRFAAALTTAFAFGMNGLVIRYGAVGQGYPLCLLLIVAAFRLAIPSAEKAGIGSPIGAGLCAGAAAASSLLTAPVAPILLLWMLIYNAAGSRAAKSGGFVAGAVIPFLPVAALAMQGPRQVIFNIFEYHFFYRQVQWSGALRHDLELMASPIDSGQGLVLIGLAVSAILFIWYRSGWKRAERAPFYLCAWLLAALTIHLCRARPTFEQYFIFLAPFLAMLAPVGLYAIGSRLDSPERTVYPVVVLTAILSLALAKRIYDDRDDLNWPDMEQTARKVREVTPPDKPLFADEMVYFLTRHTPPPNMEHHDSHKLKLPADLAALLHVAPEAEVAREVKAGMFATASSCYDDRIEELELKKLYAHSEEGSNCSVFWGWSRK